MTQHSSTGDRNIDGARSGRWRTFGIGEGVDSKVIQPQLLRLGNIRTATRVGDALSIIVDGFADVAGKLGIGLDCNYSQACCDVDNLRPRTITDFWIKNDRRCWRGGRHGCG